jgi:hypothetical protein
VDDGVELQLADELVDYGVAGVGVDELGPSKSDQRVGDIEAEDRLHVTALLEPAREIATEERGDAGDQDATRNGCCGVAYG